MKIDLVYMWVDGSDPEWIAKKNHYLPQTEQLSTEVVGDCRFVQHDELRYSLRSVERFANWINHIYIVTDNQCPAWLDTSNPRVSIIDHTEILPKEILPVFNSGLIEFYLHKIKGLSEHFLFANDDMLFGRELEPSFFFDSDQEPIVRLAKQKLKGRTGNYQRKVFRMQTKVNQRFNKTLTLAPHHNIDAYRKQDFTEAINDFKDDLKQTSLSRFRRDTDLHRSVVLYRYLATHTKPYIKIGRYNGAKSLSAKLECLFSGSYMNDSRCFAINTPDLWAKMRKYNPALFTINDQSEATDKDRLRAVKFLNEFLPTPSSFEL